jgi:hypothetical protein
VALGAINKMKKYHIIYISIIIGIIILFILKKTPCNETAVSQTYDEATKVDWTYGVDYETLIPIEEITETDPKLDVFIKNLYSIIENKNWMEIIQISNQEHYKNQLKYIRSDTQYIEENISIYPNWTNRIVIKNQLTDTGKGGFSRLNQIKELILIGMEPEIDHGKTNTFYGYIKKENGIILAVKIMILNNNGKYELTSGVG